MKVTEIGAMNGPGKDRLPVIGTRGSPLALAQATMTQAALAGLRGVEPGAIPVSVIRTTGDAVTDRALSEAGGKGLFTKEIDEAQLAGLVDVAVHSAKDLPTELPAGLVIAGYLPREDVRDALISRHPGGFAGLPKGARIGSASLRRRAMAARLRPDLVTDLLRGNVGTRLAKIEAGEFDATFLALAGLKRLGLADKVSAILSVEDFLPAVGQGAIALVARAGDAATIAAIAAIGCPATRSALDAERAMLKVLDGSCRTPIAGHATIANGRLTLRGLVLTPDGRGFAEGRREGAASEAALLGRDLGEELKRNAPPGALAS